MERENFNEYLEKAGLDWKVREIGLRTDEENSIVIPKAKSILRINPDGQDIYLGSHKENYEPYQNHELLELLFKINQSTGLDFHRGGYFGNGEKVWFQLKSESHSMPGNDRVQGYITGINSFDGSTSLGFGNSTVTISCSNSFWLGYKEMGTKLRHSGLMRPKIEEILLRIDGLVEKEQEHFRMIDRMVQVRITPEVKELVTKMLFDLNTQERLEDIKLSTRKQNGIDRFNSDYDIEVFQKEDNLWGLFSGVTRYTTHSMKKGDNTQSKLMGSAGLKEQRIWNSLVNRVPMEV